MEERGFCVNRGGEVSVPLLATWPAMGERERDALNEEVGGSEWRLKFWKKNWNFQKMEKFVVVEEGKENKKKEKGKEIRREDIFSWI